MKNTVRCFSVCLRLLARAFPGGVPLNGIYGVVLERVLPHAVHPLALHVRGRPLEAAVLGDTVPGARPGSLQVLEVVLAAGVVGARVARPRLQAALLVTVAAAEAAGHDDEDEHDEGDDRQPYNQDHDEHGVRPDHLGTAGS